MELASVQKQGKIETKLLVDQIKNREGDTADIDIEEVSTKEDYNDGMVSPVEKESGKSAVEKVDKDRIQSGGPQEWQISPLSDPLFKDLSDDQDTPVKRHSWTPALDDFTLNSAENSIHDEWYDVSSPDTQCRDAHLVTVTSDDCNSTFSSNAANHTAKESLLMPNDDTKARTSVSMDAVIQSRMEQVIQLQSPQANEIGWVPWPAKGQPKSLDSYHGKVYFPVLVLSPLTFEPHHEVRSAWSDMFYQSVLEEQKDTVDKIIVYFYKSDDSNSAFSLVNLANFIPYEDGVRKGLDRPMRLYTKVDEGLPLTRPEKEFLKGLDRIVEDSTKPGDLRGGPMFFNNLKTRVCDREWVQCDACEKWHILPSHVNFADLPGIWNCTMNTWDDKNTCTIALKTEGGNKVRQRSMKTEPETAKQDDASTDEMESVGRDRAHQSHGRGKSRSSQLKRSSKEAFHQAENTSKKKKRIAPDREKQNKAANMACDNSSEPNTAKGELSKHVSRGLKRTVSQGDGEVASVDRMVVTSVNRSLFNEFIWKILEKDGWTFEPGSQPGDSFFLPPGVSRDRRRFRKKVHYFDSMTQVLDTLSKDERWKSKPKIIEARKLYFECKNLLSDLKSNQKLPKGKLKKKWLLKQLEAQKNHCT